MDKPVLSNENAKRLQQSEERLLALLKASSDVIYHMSPDWKTMTELYGRGFMADTDEADSSWLEKYIHPDDQPHVTELIESCIKDKRLFELEHRILRPDGSIGWTHSRAIPMMNEEGNIKEWFGAASDITKVKQVEESAKKANEEAERRAQDVQNERKRFFDVLETLPVMICLITPEYRIPFANKAFRERFGEANDRYFYEYCCGYTEPCPFCESLVPLKTGRAHHWEFTSPDGNTIIDAYDFPFSDTNGSPLILEMDIDITEHRKAEEALHKVYLREEVLGELTSWLLESEDPQAIMEEICRKSIGYVECDVFINCVAEGDHLLLNSYSGISAEEVENLKRLEYDETVFGCIAAKGERIVVPDVQNSADQRVQIVRSFGVQSFAGFPLKSDDHVIGTLSFGSRKRKTFTEDELLFMNIVSGHIAIAINRLIILKALRDNRESLEEELKGAKLLKGISTELLYQEDTREFYEKIIDAASGIMHSQFASIQMLSPNGDDKGKLKLLAYRGFNQKATVFWKYVDISSGSSCGEALRTGERIIVPDLEKCDFMQGTEDQIIYLQTGIHATQTTPLYSRSGRPVGMISTHWSEPYVPSEGELRQLDVLARQAADVIDRRQFEEALRESEEKAIALVGELEETDRNKNQFISALSHELRNPLAVISAGLEILSLSQNKEQIQKAKDIMYRQMNQLCSLVDDLLDLTRISNNKIELKKEKIELNKLISLITDDQQALFDEKGMTLYTKISSHSIFIHADSVRLKQIIGNLLHNAQKYTRPGGETVLSVNEDNHEAVIRVKDNGIGLSLELIPRLFQPFVQADSSLDRSSGGLGLGLSITKGIVELHGGSVKAFSEGLGKGSEFTIRLPILDEEGADDVTKAKPVCSAARSLRILIIEDNKDFADLLSTMLIEIDYQVEVAYDGYRGLEILKHFQPDIILCDIGLPGMDGFEVAKNIKENEALKDTFLVALTGYAEEDDLKRAKESGFNRLMAKPVSLDAIQALLCEIK